MKVKLPSYQVTKLFLNGSCPISSHGWSESISHLFIQDGVGRTAPATPGLLNSAWQCARCKVYNQNLLKTILFDVLVDLNLFVMICFFQICNNCV